MTEHEDQHIQFEGELYSMDFPGFIKSLESLEGTVWLHTEKGMTRLNKAIAQEMVNKLNRYIETGVFPQKE